MHIFLLSCFEKYGGYLFVTLFLRNFSKDGVSATCLRLPGKRFQKILFSACALDVFFLS